MASLSAADLLAELTLNDRRAGRTGDAALRAELRQNDRRAGDAALRAELRQNDRRAGDPALRAELRRNDQRAINGRMLFRAGSGGGGGGLFD